MTWNTSRRLQQPEMSCAVKVYHSDTQKRILSLSLSVLLFVTLLFSSNYHPHYHQQVPDSRDTLITLQPVNYHSYRPRGSNWQYQTEDCCLLLEMLSEMKIHNFRTTLRNKEKKKKFTSDETLISYERESTYFSKTTIKCENLSGHNSQISILYNKHSKLLLDYLDYLITKY